MRHVYGFSIEAMHGDVPEMTERIRAAKAKLQQMSASLPLQGIPDDEKGMRSEHVRSRLKAGKYYSMFMAEQNLRVSFQCVCVHPGRRAYVQRTCCLGRDAPCCTLHQFYVRQRQRSSRCSFQVPRFSLLTPDKQASSNSPTSQAYSLKLKPRKIYSVPYVLLLQFPMHWPPVDQSHRLAQEWQNCVAINVCSASRSDGSGLDGPRQPVSCQLPSCKHPRAPDVPSPTKLSGWQQIRLFP